MKRYAELIRKKKYKNVRIKSLTDNNLIGRFSMLAVSNVCHLTNYYNGICSKYIAYKDNAKICIDKIFESVTTEENGLEVDVNTEIGTHYGYNNLYKNIIEGVKQLTFYDNVYIDDNIGVLNAGCIEEFNTRKIADFRTFKLNDTVEIRNSLLMGNVLYPINDDIVETWFKGIDYIPFVIKCNIGDVDVTPNREQLLYDQKTIDTINKSCQAALEEFKEICQLNSGSDFKTIKDWHDFINSNYLYVSIKKFENNNIRIAIPLSVLSYYGLSNKCTICGKLPPCNLESTYKNILYTLLPKNIILYNYRNQKFYVKENSLSIRSYINYYINGKLYFIEEPLTPIAKRYFSSVNRWDSYYFLYKKYIYSAFRKIIKEYCKVYNTNPTDPTLKFIYQDFIKNYTNIKTYGIKDVPQSFIDAEKSKAKSTKSTTQQKARKCVIYQLVHGKTYKQISYDSSMTFEELKKYKGTVFFAEKENPYLRDFYRIISDFNDFSRVILVEVAQSNLPLLRELKNTVEFSTVFIKKNKLISKICTYIYLSEKWNINHNIPCDTLSKPDPYFYSIMHKIEVCYYRLIAHNSDYTSFLKLLCKTYLDKGWLNYTIINLIESNIPYISINNFYSDTSMSELHKIITASYHYITKKGISNKKHFDLVKKTLKPILNEYTPNTELPHFNIG